MSETSTETETTETPTRVESIGSAFRQRAEAVRAGAEREREREKAEKKAAAKRRAEAQDSGEEDQLKAGETDETVDELPDMSWKKDDILDYLVRVGAVENREDVEGQTKGELLDNFIDDEG